MDETSSDTNWEYRRKFWEAYLPHIENTWVILGRQARQKAAQAKSSKFHFETNRYGHLESGSQKHSVFLIEMGGYVFVEWNDSGACRIFKIGKCPFKLYKPSYHADELRARNHQLRVIHNSPHTYNWQERLRRWIRDNTHPTIFIDGNDYKLDN